MSNQLKIILLALFLVQIGVFFWSKNTKKQDKLSEAEAIIQAYLDSEDKEQMLSLSNIKINEIPELILECQSLTALNLSHNLFEEIPPIVFQLPNLKYLNVTHNKLENVQFEENSSIQYLDLGFNKIRSIKNPNALKKLSTLVLANNKMDYCPKFEYDIYSLDLSHNQMKRFNSFANSNSRIDYLNLSNNKFSNYDFGNLASRCISLNLSFNNFQKKNFPIKLLGNNSLIKRLNLNNCGITQIKEIPENNLEELSIRNNALVIKDLNNFPQLTKLFLKATQVENLNYSNENLVDIDLAEVTINGSFTLNLPNLESFHISESIDLDKYPLNFDNIQTIYFYGDLGLNYVKLKARYPNTRFVTVTELHYD